MGDECNVLKHRLEDLESFAIKDLRKVDKEFSNKRHVRENPSGEPGEGKLEISEVMDADNLSQVKMVELISREPEVVPFTYIRTKLRPDAPPFTPECVTPVGENSHKEPKVEESCFVNIDLKSRNDQLIPETEDPTAPQLPTEIKEPELKPFSLTSTPILKKNVPQVEIMAVRDEETFITIPTNESPASEIKLQNSSEQSRNLRMTFFSRNKTQISIIIASLMICTLLIVYTVV